jgi:hypothetical protein
VAEAKLPTYASLTEFARSLRLVREHMYQVRPAFSRPGPLAFHMNSEWFDMVRAAFSGDGVGLHEAGPWSPGDTVLGYPIILDERYPEPVLCPYVKPESDG